MAAPMTFESPTADFLPDPTTITSFFTTYVWPEIIAFITFGLSISLVVYFARRSSGST